jgi:hypothetical protein
MLSLPSLASVDSLKSYSLRIFYRNLIEEASSQNLDIVHALLDSY